MVNCDFLGGMPLSEALYIIMVEEPEAVVHLGSMSGYLAINPAEDVLREVNHLSGRVLREFEQVKRDTYQMVVDAVNRSTRQNRDQKLFNDNTKRILIKMATAENKLRSFVPIGCRQVRACYRLINGGIVVVVDGDETGEYWTQDETEHNTKGERMLYMRQEDEPAKTSLHSRDRKPAAGGS